MHQKSAKIRGTVCNIPVENVADNYIVLPWPANSNGLIIVKLKRKVQYKKSLKEKYSTKVMLYFMLYFFQTTFFEKLVALSKRE